MASSSTHRRARRSQQYLNGILTVNAVLLACLVWTNISSGPSRAEAAPMLPQVQDDVQSGGVPNAAAQRERTISEIRALREDLRQLEQGMTSGKIKVNIGNLADLKKLMDESAAKSAAAAAAATSAKQEPAGATVVPSGTPTGNQTGNPTGTAPTAAPKP